MYPSAAVTAAAAITDPAPGRDMRSLLPDELAKWIAATGAPGYRGEQIFRWLHSRGIQTVDEMTNVPPTLRAALEREHPLVPLTQAARHVVPVAVTAAEQVERLRAWASGRCLSASAPGMFTRDGAPSTKPSRRVQRGPSSN